MARDFNGTSDHINLGDATEIDISSLSATVACWVRPDTIDASTFHHCFIGRGRGGTSGWKFGVGGSNNGGRLIFTKKQVADINSGAGLTLNSGTWAGLWVFAAAVLQSTQVHFFKMLMDGTVTTANTSNSSAMDNTPGPSETRVGCDLNSSGANADFFDGGIANLAVWVGDELSDDELKAYAYGGIAAVGRQPDLYLPLWAVADPEPDLSGNGNHGTVSGASAAPTRPPTGPYVRPRSFSFRSAASNAYTQTLTGALTLSGGVRSAVASVLAGALTLAGGPRMAIAALRSGALSFSGSALQAVAQLAGGSVTFSGSVARSVSQRLVGGLTLAGSLGKAVANALGGVLSFVGNLVSGASASVPPIVFDVDLADPEFGVELAAPVFEATLSVVDESTELS
jgi:hypothetical protein